MTVFLLAWTWWWACSPTPGAVRFVVHGCVWVADDGRCFHRPNASITVWVDSDTAPRSPAVDWHPVPADRGGGFRGVVQADGSSVEIRTATGRATVALAESAITDPVLTEARRVVASGTPEEKELHRHIVRERLSAVSGIDRVEWMWVLLVLEDSESSAAKWEQEYLDIGVHFWAAKAALYVAYQAVRDGGTGSTADATAAVARARSYTEQIAVQPYVLVRNADQYTGLGQQLTGNHRAALDTFASARSWAARLGVGVDEADSLRKRADSLIATGQAEEALSELPSGGADACEQALNLQIRAWNLVEIREASSMRVDEDPLPLLDEAITILESRPVCDGRARIASYLAHVYLNRALASVQANDPSSALADLDAAARVDPTVEVRWAKQIRARAAGLLGDLEQAVALHREVYDEAGDQLQLAWLARAGEGISLMLRDRPGDRAHALEALTDAQQLLFRQGLLVPVQFAEAAHLRQRDEVTSFLADLLFDAGRDQEAFDAYRTQRAQYLLGLHQALRLASSTPSVSWTEALADYRSIVRRLARESPDEFPTRVAELQAQAQAAIDRGFAALGVGADRARRRPSPGELLIGWFPVYAPSPALDGRPTGWRGVAELDGVVQRVDWRGETPPSGSGLVAPFAAQVDAATAITLVPHADLGDQDLLALFPLDKHARYSLDLLGTDRANDAAPPRTALVVGDPLINASQARASARATAERLSAEGWSVKVLFGDEATREAVVEALKGTALFHYAGHAVARPGWSSNLRLANDEVLTATDVLVLDGAPHWVVLNACEVGNEKAGTLGLAQAFVARGTREAIANRLPVDPAVASTFAEALYAQWDGRSSFGATFGTAAVAVAGRGTGSGSYRFLVR